MFKSSKNSSKNPHFFCENCGFEVPKDAESCPKCGRFFSSVRCPSCGFEGEPALFKDGCPVCGYSSGKSAGKSAGKTRDFQNEFQAQFPEKRKAAGPLPFWLYILTAAAFTAILAALFFAVF